MFEEEKRGEIMSGVTTTDMINSTGSSGAISFRDFWNNRDTKKCDPNDKECEEKEKEKTKKNK